MYVLDVSEHCWFWTEGRWMNFEEQLLITRVKCFRYCGYNDFESLAPGKSQIFYDKDTKRRRWSLDRSTISCVCVLPGSDEKETYAYVVYETGNNSTAIIIFRTRRHAARGPGVEQLKN